MGVCPVRRGMFFAGDPSLNVTGRLGSESWARHVLTISAVTVGDSPSRVFPASMEPAPHGVTACLFASRRSQCDSFVWWCVCNEFFNV